MSDLSLLAGTNLAGCQSHDSDGFAVKRRELYFITFASSVNEHDRANIAPRQSVFRQVTGKNNVCEFLNHDCLLFRGWAVMNLGESPSFSINHALRTFNHVPSGAFKSPSITYRLPKLVLSSRAISLSIACCFKAAASFSPRPGATPNSTKKD